ncbi:MAG: hypothetical protein EZS28_054282 [Streblomastix strix]|uniref:Uncharacterized protein n=1 Tax=Streblomastix strix TaxID=222440 RepID=A0A5J4QRI1_9EUKA|nr:MAG: hypothetical protein EZS28_054282 [Streblomastix strix]
MLRSAEQQDKEYISCGDYGLMVEGIPKEEFDAKNIFDHFNVHADVHSVLLCYDCRKHADLQKQIDSNVIDYHRALKSDDVSMKNICHYTLYNLTAKERQPDFAECDGI